MDEVYPDLSLSVVSYDQTINQFIKFNVKIKVSSAENLKVCECEELCKSFCLQWHQALQGDVSVIEYHCLNAF